MFPQRYNSHKKLKDSGNPTYAAIVSKINSLIAAYYPSKKTSVPSSLCGYAPVKKIRFGDNTNITVGPVPSRPTDPRPRARALRNLNGIHSRSIFANMLLRSLARVIYSWTRDNY
jgi:hypothetical protein